MNCVYSYLLAHSDGVSTLKSPFFSLAAYLKSILPQRPHLYSVSSVRISQTTTGNIITFYSDNLPFFFFWSVLHFWLFPMLVFFLHLEYNECIVFESRGPVLYSAYQKWLLPSFWTPSDWRNLTLMPLICSSFSKSVNCPNNFFF